MSASEFWVDYVTPSGNRYSSASRTPFLNVTLPYGIGGIGMIVEGDRLIGTDVEAAATIP